MPTAGRTTKPLEVLQALCLTIEEDFLLALRFNYYVRARSLVPDAMYDAAERDFLERPEIEDSPLMNPGSDNPADYSDAIKALSLYLALTRLKEVRTATKEPIARPVTPPKSKSKGKTAQYFEAPYVGDLFPEI